jgi:hypothetical protein
MQQVMDSIYLNKRGHEQNTSHWAYYRVTSLGGGLGDHIQVCLVQWPSFSDIDVVGDAKKATVVNPSDTGYNSAFPNLLELLSKKWNIDHEQSTLIGLRARPE